MLPFHRTLPIVLIIAGALIPAAKADLIAAYTFNNTLSAVQPGVSPLTAVDPLGTSGFGTATVFGNSQTVSNFNGLASPVTSQGGLDFNTTGLISSNNYSVEMVLELTGNSGWRRLLDSLDRQSDAGLYIDPSNNLDSYPNGGSGSPFSANTFFDIFVTVDPSNTVTGYFSGVQQFSETSTSLVIATNTLGFFLDNVAGGGQGEWSSGSVALIKVFNTALTADQVKTETADPFQGTTTTTPEPGTWLLMIGAGGLLAVKRFAIGR
jgi:hypothetical protein